MNPSNLLNLGADEPETHSGSREEELEHIKLEIIRLLNRNLATGLDLALQAKQAHWNVKGPAFLQLHELFDRLHAEVSAWNDQLAERAVQLGGVAAGTLQAIVPSTPLSPYPGDAVAGTEHLRALVDAVRTYTRSLRASIDAAERLKDPATADLFTELVRGADEKLWMLEAHLQAES
ncbi:MAG: DNA starvation/stationary phase protection protein Dps [Deltaproteobacteria bacterium]|nr:DNA starvation/stationary phase protection protein Dps [Deltaproteobacteria bacterium]